MTDFGVTPVPVAVAAKNALYEAAKVALAGDAKVDIFRGTPWPQANPDYFAVRGGRAEYDPATMGPRRSLDETLVLEVDIVGWSPLSGNEGEQQAQDRAFAIFQAVAQHVRLNDSTLGGLVIWCLPGDFAWDGETNPENQADGSLCAIAATFRAFHRVS